MSPCANGGWFIGRRLDEGCRTCNHLILAHRTDGVCSICEAVELVRQATSDPHRAGDQ